MVSPIISPDWSKKGSYWFDLWDSSARDDLCASLECPAIGTVISNDAAMFLALCAALKGVGFVSPNPIVGAVIVDKDGKFIASGAHLRVGQNHAEINALENLPDHADLAGATMFVTLEPCSHVGRTPSCAQALAKLAVNRIVYAVRDPNPLVNGAGHKILQDAGKSVEIASDWTSRCEWLSRVFLFNQRRGRVFTGMKVASTPDGFVAGDKTSRLWITGERARNFGHFLRMEYDAILIGLNTLTLDDPMLNVRHPSISGRTPLRIVLDPEDHIKNDSRPFKILCQEPSRTMIVRPGTRETQGQMENGVFFLELPVDKKGSFDFEMIKKHLWNKGLRSLLIEGGARTYESALSSSSVDAIHWFIGNHEVQSGLKWPIPGFLGKLLSAGAGISLGSDRLIEVCL